MKTSTLPDPSAAEAAVCTAPEVQVPPAGGKIFTIGTLRYTMAGIWMLFFLLLWNDVVLMLMEQVPGLTAYIWKDCGATQTQMALWGSLSGPLTIWINPVFSTWSDRCRTRMGRRRPFLLFAAPPCALFLALIPFMPDLAQWAMHWPVVAHWAEGNVATVAIPLLGICGLIFGAFNAVILSIFSYYFWDVVPESLFGRFQSLTRIAATGACALFNYCIFGQAEHHMRAIFVGMAILFVIVYVATVWKVREGEYPPPEPRQSGGLCKSAWQAIRGYVTDCFGQPRYLWIFAAFTLIQIGNQTGPAKAFLNRYQLGMDMDTIGKMSAWSGPAIMLLGYPLGSLIDRLGAMRLAMPCLLLWALSNVVSFFFLRGPWSLLICTILVNLTIFAYSICIGVMTVEVFPREKLGQFCSASAICQQIVCWGTIILAGLLFDYLGEGYYHYSYLWSAAFEVLGVVLFIKIYRDWKQRKAAVVSPSSATAA